MLDKEEYSNEQTVESWVMEKCNHWRDHFTNNYEDMGTIQDEWLANGSRLQSKFDSVEDCGVHAMYYVYVARPPAEPFSDGFMTV